MPLPLPNLDTQTFDDLVKEMQALIPRYAPDWTNHNLSDSGITLVDLLAYLTETMLYRVNQIPDKTYLNFLSLLTEKKMDTTLPLDALKTDILRSFNEPYRAITVSDFEREAKKAESGSVSRVRVLSDATGGTVVVVVVPTKRDIAGTELSGLLERIKAWLDARRLICTRIFVREATYTNIQLEIKVIPRANTLKEVVTDAVENAVRTFLDPLKGGTEGTGWPFGRSVSVFELYTLVKPITGIDHVVQIAIIDNNKKVEIKEIGDLPTLILNPKKDIELVNQ